MKLGRKLGGQEGGRGTHRMFTDDIVAASECLGLSVLSSRWSALADAETQVLRSSNSSLFLTLLYRGLYFLMLFLMHGRGAWIHQGWC